MCGATSAASSSAIGGSPRPPWIRIGTSALDGEREDRLQAVVPDRELLRAGMELDPARAEVEAADRLLERAGVEVEAHERDEAARPIAAAAASVRSFADAERRLAVGLVEAERERAREAVLASIPVSSS